MIIEVSIVGIWVTGRTCVFSITIGQSFSGKSGPVGKIVSRKDWT